jgi:hypothetical protein
MTTREARKSKETWGKRKEETMLRALTAVKYGVGVREAERSFNTLKLLLGRVSGKLTSSDLSIGHTKNLTC